MTDTATKWRKLVTGWKASGETAEAYAGRHGFAASTLRYWSWRLRRDLAVETEAEPKIRFARLVRMPAVAGAPSDGTLVIELLDARARITVSGTVSRDALASVIDVLETRARGPR